MAGMIVLAYIGAQIGLALSRPNAPDESQVFATRLLMLAGAGLGLLVTPRLTIEPLQRMLRSARNIELSELLFVLLGGFIGLIFAVMLAVPVGFLPSPFREFVPTILAFVCVYLGAVTFASHRRSVAEWKHFVRRIASLNIGAAAPAGDVERAAPNQRRYLLDTSAIIDGRIAEVSKTGFLEGVLVVPRFVLIELQGLADSADDLRRSKGRRGLDLLNQMQQNPVLPIEVLDVDMGADTRVDDNLVVLARQRNYPIITNDFNLNRVAGLQGVRVLSLNQLSEAVRPPVLQDQHLQVLIRNEGNARQQGVGYLEDGTPVIVEDARHLIGQNVEVVVIRLHQTQTGRLVFAQLNSSSAS
jgi:uncharacterized protein YacL